MKKLRRLIAAAGIASVFVSAVSAADLAFRVMPGYSSTDNSNYEQSFSGHAGFEIAPFTVRGRDQLFAGVLGGFLPINATGIETINIFDVQAVLGYTVRLSDRFSFTGEGHAGIWSVSEDEEQGFPGSSGLAYGGRASLNFHLLPELTAGIFADYTIYDYDPEPFIKNTEIGLSLRYSFTKGLFSKSAIKKSESNLSPLFPVFYSRYDDHSFGSMTFVNNEANDITDVEVYVFIEQFMSNPDLAFKLAKINRGESFTADLTAFLNENILNNLGVTETNAIVTVSYKSLGKRIRYEEPVFLTTLSRNSMTWEDDRQAAAFASGHDASAYLFARRVKSIVKDNLVEGIPENIQYAAAIFGALKTYGINYVIDPASAFTDNVGTSAVDFLQFPYQTLLYHGGDCDDLTILNCSLLEAIGIDTAMITIPGHIYMAFDAGVSPENSAKAGDCLVIDGKVWIPLEITLCQDSFALERLTGIRQWRKNGENAAIIPLKDAWQEFKAVSVPDSDVRMELPVSAEILREFKKQIQ